MPWLKRVAVSGHWAAKDFDVELTAEGREKPLHLILTGPNGAGKTTILAQLAGSLQSFQASSRSRHSFAMQHHWTRDRRSCRADFRDGKLVLLYLPAQRKAAMKSPDGPTNQRFGQASAGLQQADLLVQYLVNQKVQAKLADPDLEEERAESEAIERWFLRFQEALGQLFERSALTLTFDRKAYNFTLEAPGMPSIRFDQLAAGHASALAIFAELVLRIDAADAGLTRDSDALSGVAVIDELSLHLHPSMQEKILPFLTRAFPRLQFIVATHSPAIVSSVPDAMVVDLGSGAAVHSSALQGTPYGELMKTHFGIETDIDLDSTRALARLDELNDKAERTTEEDAELAALAERLTRTSHPLALQVWNRITAKRLREEARAEVAG